MSTSMWRRLLCRGPRCTRSRTRGQALVELALILPVFLLLFASALDLGRLFYSQITVNDAAREGALEASRNPSSYLANTACTSANKDANRIMCRTLNEATGGFVTVAPADVALTCSTSPCPPVSPAMGDTISVKVTGHFTLATPLLSGFFGGQSITFSSTASAQLFAPPTVAATPTPTPTPEATPTPTPTPEATPTPTPTPSCLAPAGGPITVSPPSGHAANNGGNNATLFTFSSATVTNMTADCSPVWSWNFGDGSGASSAASPTYSYPHSQDLKLETVTLAASNSAGSQTYTLTIQLN